MFLNALNNARRGAEMIHNFEYARVTATISIDGTSGAALSSATISTSGSWNGIKEVHVVQRTNGDGSLEPLDFCRLEVATERVRTEIEMSNVYWPDARYPTDARLLSRGASGSVVQSGSSLFIYPRATVSVTPLSATLEATAWLGDYSSSNYSDSTPTDFLIQYGFEYLQWATIVELNFIFKTFVPRQEGNLASPDKYMENAWNRLIEWDTYMIDSHMTRSR